MIRGSMRRFLDRKKDVCKRPGARRLMVEPLEERSLLAAVTASLGPDNDQFKSAIPLLSGSVVNGSNVGATAEDGEPAHADDEVQHSVWYKMTVPAGMLATITVTPTDLTFDAQVAAYTGPSVDALVFETSRNTGGPGAVEKLELSNSSGAAANFAIAVDGLAGSMGLFKISAVLNTASGPANDDFDRAIPLPLGTEIAGTTTIATAESGEPPHAGDAAQESVWYSVTAPSGATVIVTARPEYDAQLAAYLGAAVGSLSLVTSANNGGSGVAEQVQLTNSTANPVTYKIAVDGPAGDSGDFTIIAEIAGVNHAPTCSILFPPSSTDEDALQTVPGVVTHCLANDADQTVSFTIAVDKPELFTTPPAVNAAGTLTYDPAPNVHGEGIVTVTITDTGGTTNGGGDTTIRQFSITIEKPHRWHNTKHPINVDADGSYSSGDTILLLNFLNSRLESAGPGPVPNDAPYFGEAGFYAYIDVDPDGNINATDTITVLNFLNSRLPGAGPGPIPSGEGEAAAELDDADLFALLAGDIASQARRRR